MEFRRFEKEFLRLTFTTDIEISPASLAFITDISVSEAERHLRELLDQGTLELDSDDDGNLKYRMPDRPPRPLRLDHPAIVGSQVVSTEVFGDLASPSRALVVRRIGPAEIRKDDVGHSRALASLFLNALVCPGVGSMVGGRTGVGVAQLAVFLVGLPLAVMTVGLPLMLTSWAWGLVTGAQLIAEAKD